MPSERSGGSQTSRRLNRLEAVALLLAAPWLLFPSVLPVLTVIALVGLVLMWLWVWWRTGRPLSVTPFNLALLPWALALIPAILVTADPDLTLPKATGLLLGLALWRFLALYAVPRRTFYLALAAFLLLGLGVAGLGALAVGWQYEIPFLQPIYPYLPERLIALPGQPSFGVHPNELAGSLSLYLLLPIAMLVGWRGRLRDVTALVLAALVLSLVLLLLMTGSRSGWIALLAGLVVLASAWLYLSGDGPQRRMIVTGLLTLMLLAAALFLVIGPGRLLQWWEAPPQETAVGNLGTLRMRAELWPWALTAIGDFPFTGTGLGTFRRVVFRLYPVAIPPTTDVGHAHNTFLQVALDTGLPGFIAYLALLLVGLVSAWRVAAGDEASRPIALGLGAGLVAVHVFGLFDAMAVGAKPGFLLWMNLGLLAALSRRFPAPGAITPEVDGVVGAATKTILQSGDTV